MPPRKRAKVEDDDAPVSDPRVLAQLAVPLEQRCSAQFKAYYKEQLFRNGNAYGNLDDFLKVLATPSPMTLRIHQTRPLSIRQRTATQVSKTVP